MNKQFILFLMYLCNTSWKCKSQDRGGEWRIDIQFTWEKYIFKEYVRQTKSAHAYLGN